MCINFSKFNGIVLWVNFLDLIEYFKDLQKKQCCWSPRNRNVTNLMKYVLYDPDTCMVWNVYDEIPWKPRMWKLNPSLKRSPT